MIFILILIYLSGKPVWHNKTPWTPAQHCIFGNSGYSSINDMICKDFDIFWDDVCFSSFQIILEMNSVFGICSSTFADIFPHVKCCHQTWKLTLLKGTWALFQVGFQTAQPWELIAMPISEKLQQSDSEIEDFEVRFSLYILTE